MAFIELTPVTWNIAVKGPYRQKFRSPVIKDADGSPVDLSAWAAINLVATPLTPVPLAMLDATALQPTGGADGTLLIDLSTTEIAGMVANGSCNITVSGKQAGGDTDNQLLATGVLTVGGSINFA